MRNTVENSDEQPVERRGLQGKKAFFVVVGSGVLAALLVFGVVVGVVRTLGAALAGSPASGQGGGEGVAPERGPVEEMKVGALDLCQALEQEGLQGDLPERQDSGDAYADTGSSPSKQENRMVSDECRWTIEPEYKRILTVELSYRAYVSEGDGGSSTSLARDYFRKEKSALDSEFADAADSGAMNGFGEESHYVFGVSKSDERQFMVSGRGKSGVLVLRFTEDTPGEPTDAELKEELQGKAMEAAPRLFGRFDRLLPD